MERRVPPVTAGGESFHVKKVADADPANGGAAPVTDGSTQKNLAGTLKVNEEAIEKDLNEKS